MTKDRPMWGWATKADVAMLSAKLDASIVLLNRLLSQENIMAIDLTALTAEVTNNTNVTASVLALVKNLAAQIAAIPPSTDPTTQAALNTLVSTLSSNDAAIAAAVTANTPAAPPSS
jgi:hypothetical protein